MALARPQFSNAFTRVESSGIDIMIVLDVSRSMLAEDYRGEDGRRANRITTVKKLPRQFIEQRPAAVVREVAELCAHVSLAY